MKKKKSQINNFVFYISYTLILMSVMFYYVNGINKVLNILSDFAIAVLIFNFAIQAKKYKKKEIFILFLLIILSILVTFFSKEKQIMRLVLLICTAISIDFKKFVKYDFKVKIIFAAIIITCYYLGLTEVYYMYREDGTIRSSMGFSHPNVFGGFIFSIICDYIFLRAKKLNILDVIIIVSSSFIVSYFSDSRTSQICIILVLIGAIFVKFDKMKILDCKVMKIFIRNSFFIFAIMSFLLAYLYSQNNPIVINLNEKFSGRISFISRFFEEYDIHLFGQEIEIVGTVLSQKTGKAAWILDNAYSMILLRYGLITFLLMGYALNKFFRYAYKENKYILIIMLIFLILRDC